MFGEAVEQYANARPGYPEELVDDVMSYGGPIGTMLEVGAGTGKATVAFAALGVELTCLEPDPRMAARLARECAGFANVAVVSSRFEAFVPPARFDALIAAQSWHWVDHTRRWTLAHQALRAGGTIALFWNRYVVADEELRGELARIDRRHGVDNASSSYGVIPSATGRDVGLEENWPADDLAADGRFEDVTSRRYRRQQAFTAELYLDLMASTSWYRVLDDDVREAVMAAAKGTIEAHGGEFTLDIVTALFLARTTEASGAAYFK